MKISNNTIEVLKNFAAINSNIIFLPGQDLKTINEAKSILGIAKIQEDFPKEFGNLRFRFKAVLHKFYQTL